MPNWHAPRHPPLSGRAIAAKVVCMYTDASESTREKHNDGLGHVMGFVVGVQSARLCEDVETLVEKQHL